MPHAYLKKFKSSFAQLASLKLGDIEAFIINYAEQKIYEINIKLLRECPPPEVLLVLSKEVDNINRLMNKGDITIGTVAKLPKKLDKPIKAGIVITEILGHMPIPASIPPGIGIPLGIIQTQSQILSWASSLVETLQDEQKKIGALLTSTQGIFAPIRAKLVIIENLLSSCASNPNMTDEERRTLIRGVQRVQIPVNNTLENNISGVEFAADNGKVYNLLVVVENNITNPAPKRQAIGKDNRGVTVIKGPLSFASSEEVLIDELKFRINNQLP
jgi:hypothetical protein